MSRTAGACLLALLFTVGCTPLRGVFYTDVKETGIVEAGGYGPSGRNMVSYQIDEAMGPGSKVGEVFVDNYAYLVAIGDASVEGAASAGGIKKVHTVETLFKNYWWVYTRMTIRVTGE